MRILALITARGGSKRLPGKNIRILGDKPLIVWSIDVARDIPEICDILVSTDDTTIASVCSDAGALVPWCLGLGCWVDAGAAGIIHAIFSNQYGKTKYHPQWTVLEGL